MAPRRTSRPSLKPPENVNFDNLSLNDVLCPICRSILIEPVTLPCSHGFCLSCFNGTMENTNLVCPLCRVRISSWLRTANKEKRVVNVSLWKAIKETFPQQVNNKLNGVDENLEEIVSTVRLASPGSVRREYEEQKKKEDLEIKKQREAEQKASEELITKLRAEEEHRRKLNEERIKLDEEVAKKLADALKSDQTPCSSKVCAVPPSKKQNKIDTFVKRTYKDLPESEFTTKILCQDRKSLTQNSKSISHVKKIIQQVDVRNSNDSIESECCYFKSLDHRNIPPSKATRMIRIPAKLASAATVIIGAPRGEISFKHFMESPFVSLKICENLEDAHSSKDTDIPKKEIEASPGKKRKNSKVEPERTSPRKKCRVNYSESPINADYTYENDVRDTVDAISPAFCGFDNSVKTNGVFNNAHLIDLENKINKVTNKNQEALSKEKQENEDFELAKKLHEQLNNNGYRNCTRKAKRNKQLILDFMISPSHKMK